MLATLLAAVAVAFPSTFPVPAGSQPEGIAAGHGTTLYVGSRVNGSVYQADARTGRGRILVPAQAGRGAYGLKLAGGRLYVAGGPTGFGFVYDARTGGNVDAVDFGGGFVNDVTVTKRAAYFTDSLAPQLYVYPRRGGGAPRTLPLTGDYMHVPDEFNANGIAATPDGRTLIIVQSVTGKLFTVHARTGVTREIDLGGATVTNGDGLLLTGHTLHVVRNQDNEVAVIRLSPNLARGTLIDTLRDPDFDTPTTIARLGRRLYAINARFSVAEPTPETTYDVVLVDER